MDAILSAAHSDDTDLFGIITGAIDAALADWNPGGRRPLGVTGIDWRLG
ncbi:MAG TPA: hypothetical protein VM347_14640 [Nonomuraea sp.]|nr:hypothetical protein [Nonomuraea sp.]